MIITQYIIVGGAKSRYGGLTPKLRLVQKVPTLKGNEFSLRLQLDIPDAIFKRPQLSAELTVPDTAVSSININPDVTKKIESIIKETTGLTMNVSVIEHEEECKHLSITDGFCDDCGVPDHQIA